jgi:hypothetical protein
MLRTRWIFLGALLAVGACSVDVGKLRVVSG